MLLRRARGRVAEGLETLGLRVEDLQKLSPDEQFRTLAQAIAGVENPSTQAALAQKLLGGAGRDLLPTLKAGAEGLDALSQEARDNSNIMSTQTVRSAERVNDVMNSAKDAIRGVALQAFEFILPYIERAVVWVKTWIDENRDLIAVAKAVGGVVVNVLGLGFKILSGIFKNAVIPLLKGVRDAFFLVVDGVNAVIRVYNKLPSSLKVFGDLKEVTFDFKDATDEAAASVSDMARETADAVFPVRDLTTGVEDLTAATREGATATSSWADAWIRADEAARRARGEIAGWNSLLNAFTYNVGLASDAWGRLQRSADGGLPAGGGSRRRSSSSSGGGGGGGLEYTGQPFPVPGRGAFSYLTDDEFDAHFPNGVDVPGRRRGGGGTTHVTVELDGVKMAEATVATVNAARNRGELD